MAFTKVTGTLVDIGDLDLTNVGQIQLDSIAGDADANTSITFSGSDVITIATGGTTALTVDANQKLTANSGVAIDNITIDGTEIDLSSGDLTLDVAGDIILDADGSDITLKDGGTEVGNISLASSNFMLSSSVSDKDIIFTGNDGGSAITALTLDMSAAGKAVFNKGATFASTTVHYGNGSAALDWGDTSTVGQLSFNGNNAILRVTNPGDFLFQGNDGSSNFTALQLDTSDAGTAIFNHDIKLPDAGQAIFGADTDLSIQHNGSNGFAINNTGDFYLRNDNISYITNVATSKNSAAFDPDGAVSLYYNNNLVFNTESGAARISSHGTGGTLNLFSDSGTNEGQFNITYLTDGSSDAHSVAEIRMQQGSGDGSARKGEMLFRVSDNGGPATAMTIANNGIISTAGNLNVKGSVTHPLSQLVVNNGSGDGGISIYSGSTSTSRLMFADAASGGGQYDGFLAYDHTNQRLFIGTAGSGASDVTINSAGHVALEATARLYLDGLSDTYISEYSANEFEIVTGGGRRFALSGGNTFISGSLTQNHNFSDERLKENIVVIPNALEKVSSLRGVTFTRKSDGSVGTGLIAQELDRVLPEAVYETKAIESLDDPDAEEYKSIRYETTVGLLVEAIKELEARIKTLEG